MMDDVERAIAEAWWEMGEKIVADRGELERRQERRKSRQFLRPLRAWCVSVRANDHRIDDATAIIVPRHAISLEAAAHPGRYAEHEVVLTDELVARLCGPCEIGRPGEPADVVAERLGCGTSVLLRLRRSGQLRTTPKPGLRGRRGRPVPLVYVERDLDPCARSRFGPDEAFGPSWRSAYQRMPEGFRQTLTRMPRYWRSRGRERFMGWAWVCPCCRGASLHLYYPLPHPDMAVWYSVVPPPQPWRQTHAPVFACWDCHNIVSFNRGQLGMAWNQLVLHYSGGLLYGHEVEKPAWLKAEEPRETRLRTESAKRLQVKRLLVTTEWSCEQIGREVGMALSSVGKMSCRIYRQESVRNRAQLREKLAAQYPIQREARRAG